MNITIHTYDKQWEGAELTSIGTDTLTGQAEVLSVRHPEFGNGLSADFYRIANEQGRHHNVGNRAYWITIEE